MEFLLDEDTPFVFVFPNSVENETHEDQKRRMLYLKVNKGRLSSKCLGIFGVEPDRAKRILVRAQALIIAAASGLRLRISESSERAMELAELAVRNAPLPDDAE